MSDSVFDLPEAAALFSEQMSTITSLWTVYVVAVFATSGYGLSPGGIGSVAAGTVTVGFLIFACGNLVLLRQSLLINKTLSADIVAALDKAAANKFDKSLRFLAAKANPVWISTSAHLLIDCCVLIILWNHGGGLSRGPATPTH